VYHVFTIGYRRRSLASFVCALQEHDVDVLVDVRLRNTSHLAGYTKRDDLRFLLTQGFGIDYEHRPDLAPTDEILERFKQDEDWVAYEEAFTPLLMERDAQAVGRSLLATYNRPCLLCAEETPERCHRRLVAEYWAAHLPCVDIEHL